MSTTTPTQLGMIGVGRMGTDLIRRLLDDGHRCIVYDVNADSVAELVTEGAIGASTPAEFVDATRRGRTMSRATSL